MGRGAAYARIFHVFHLTAAVAKSDSRLEHAGSASLEMQLYEQGASEGEGKEGDTVWLSCVPLPGMYRQNLPDFFVDFFV